MVEPRVVPRAEHTLSRSDVDPDALKVLYRLRQGDYVAYLVGGSVRDLLLGPASERFRHRHVGASLSGQEAVSELLDHRPPLPTGARQVRHEGHRGRDLPTPGATGRRDRAGRRAGARTSPARRGDSGRRVADRSRGSDEAQLIHRDNTFGTPEEDAFRRDFTINALFYDIATFSIIDYVGGLDDLQARLVRCIGDPDVRFREDPVRMLRAVALAARLDFTIEQPIHDAIGRLRHEIANSSAARLLEEYYKILRAGSAEATFRGLPKSGLLEPISAELHEQAGDASLGIAGARGQLSTASSRQRLRH